MWNCLKENRKTNPKDNGLWLGLKEVLWRMYRNSVKLSLVGDIFPGNLTYNTSFGIAGQFRKHRGEKWFLDLKKIFANSEIVFGNLEAPLIDDVIFAARNSFVGSYEFGAFLKKVGVNIVSVANNHILEQNENGFKNTINCLRNINVKCVGINNGKISNIEIFCKKNIIIAFAAFNAIHDIKNTQLYADYSEKSVLETLNEMSSLNADFKIISLHWGNEFINIPSASQIRSAHRFIDHGANVIVGHHPHVVQPAEEYNNGLIFYSLGNFLFDMLWSKNVRKGIVAHVYLGQDKEINYELLPIILNDDYLPVAYSKKSFDRFHERMLSHVENDFKNNQKKYVRDYKYRLLINHFFQRIMMKYFILKRFNRMDKSAREELKRNVINRIFRLR